MLRTRCPCCSTETLVAYSIDDHELEKCTTCEGIWFDEPELMAYIEAHAEDSTKAFKLISEESHRGESARYCHDCQKPMVKHELLENHSTEIDACHSCNTFWIDIEEIKHVQHSHDLRAALADIHKGFTWRSWFFELLFRMPVEYNSQPKKTPWVTYILILINILLFSTRFISPSLEAWTFENLSTVTPIVDYSQFFASLVSAQFMHLDLMHLIGNLYFLWIIGDNIEDALGKRKYLLAYMICGTIGMLLEVAFALLQDRTMFLMGASAAVSGLFGMYVIWFRHAKLSVMVIVYQFRLPAIWFFSIWLLTNVIGFVWQSGNVAFLAHLGGFFAGLLFALAYKSTVYKKNPLLHLLNTPSFGNKPSNSSD